MSLKVHYDREADIVTIRTGRTPSAGSSLEDTMHIVVETGCKGDQDVVGLVVMGASSYLAPHFVPHQRKHPLSRYDGKSDTLTLGTVANSTEMISLGGESSIVVHWKLDETDGNVFDPIGVTLQSAARLLSPLFEPVVIKPSGAGEQ